MIPELGKGFSVTPGRSPTTLRVLSVNPTRWTQRLGLRSFRMWRLGLEMFGLGRLSAAQYTKPGTQTRVPNPSPQLPPGTLIAWQLQGYSRPPDPVPSTPHLPNSPTPPLPGEAIAWSIAALWNRPVSMRRPGRIGKGTVRSQIHQP